MNKPGFTLVELLVAAGIFLVSVAAFTYLMRVASLSLDNALEKNQQLYTYQASLEATK